MARLATALALALAAALAALAPAASAKGERMARFEITRAAGFVRVTFHGDEAAGCRDRGVCGASGTVTRSYGPGTFGQLLWLRRGSRTLFLHAFLDEGHGEIAADVGTAGSPERCVDRVRTGFDSFDLRPRRGRLRFIWREPADGGFVIGADHDGVPPTDFYVNPFATRCAGPQFVDFDDALPGGEIPFRVVRSRRSSFRLTGVQPFAGGGFAGTVDWDLRYGLRLRRSGR